MLQITLHDLLSELKMTENGPEAKQHGRRLFWFEQFEHHVPILSC